MDDGRATWGGRLSTTRSVQPAPKSLGRRVGEDDFGWCASGEEDEGGWKIVCSWPSVSGVFERSDGGGLMGQPPPVPKRHAWPICRIDPSERGKTASEAPKMRVLASKQAGVFGIRTQTHSPYGEWVLLHCVPSTLTPRSLRVLTTLRPPSPGPNPPDWRIWANILGENLSRGENLSQDEKTPLLV
jgi:hypothetical protein